MSDYHDICLRTDVLLLADVFETFRSMSMQHCGFDPAHYFSAPGVSWDALLKITKVELELLTDIDVHLFMEKSVADSAWYLRGSPRPTTHNVWNMIAQNQTAG